MTLVDLPGICRVPVGDQPADIEARQQATRFPRYPLTHSADANC